ncbi:MAG: hypothetical protein H9W83_04935, partial [Leuconostoc sp.]|nr:hypothetical protein [Leuconostoc sp.]
MLVTALNRRHYHYVLLLLALSLRAASPQQHSPWPTAKTPSSKSKSAFHPPPPLPVSRCPFLARQLTHTPSDVLNQIAATRSLFSSYLRIRSHSTNPHSDEILSARSDLEASLKTLAEDLSDLVSSVEAIQASPNQFGLSSHEVLRRKRLVDDVDNEVQGMRRKLHSSSSLPNPSQFEDEERGTAEEDAYGAFEQQEQVRIMAEQD